MKKIIVKIGRGVVRVGTGILRFFGSVQKVDEIYNSLPPESKAAAMKTFQDLLAFVAAAAAAGAVRGTSLPLDSAVLAAAEQLYSDALQDIDSAKKVFAALGVSLTPAAPAKAA
jgi:hypothetical protein